MPDKPISGGIVANGGSGIAFNFVQRDSLASRNMPAHVTWHLRPVNDPYRREWDSFARLLNVNGQDKANFPIILDALNRHFEKVTQAHNRSVAPGANARYEAAQAALAASFEPIQNRALTGLTSPKGGLTALTTNGIASLINDTSINSIDWGQALQGSLTNLNTRSSFYRGVAEGVFSGGKDLVIGLASVVGQTVQFGADSTIVGELFDGVRGLLPSKAQLWMRESSVIPSAERARATSNMMITSVVAVGTYIANTSPEQVGADLRAFFEKNWDSLKTQYAAETAKGPAAQARWLGQIIGRAMFEIAAIAIPASKVIQLARSVTGTIQVTSRSVALSSETLSLRGALGIVGVKTANRTRAVKLSFDKITRTWSSPAGLNYGMGSTQGNRVKHVLEHAIPDPSKAVHSVFNVERREVLGLVDEAWNARQGAGVLQNNGNRIWVVDMGRPVGTAGESNLRIIVRDGTNRVITAYPSK
jgi:hypothetical protein